jgi:phage tail sheath protein FI
VLLFPEVYEDSLSIVAGAITATDDGDGNLTGTGITSGTIDYETGAWTLTYDAAPASGALIMAAYDTVPAATEVCCQLTGGADGTGPITRALISQSDLEADKEGIYAFNAIDDILNMDLPDFSGDTSVQGDLIAYCAGRGDRFAILGTASNLTPSAAKKWLTKTAQYNTSYAALYYPWVTISDPLTDDGRPLNVPPGGFIAGVFARTDAQRNVGKAPAGINDGQLLGCIGLERVLEKGERDILYPVRINPLVASAQTGRAVWGQKTLSLDAEWSRVQARRLFIFLEKSIENASYWVVFENNGPATWARMLAQGNGFFTALFRDGYFKGDTPAEAFKIVIDETNNPQSVIDQYMIIADYYAAPNKAGEFIRLRFAQKLQSA